MLSVFIILLSFTSATYQRECGHPHSDPKSRIFTQSFRRSAVHPLDPLTDTEMTSTAQIIRRYRPNIDWVFHSIILYEPPKAEILQYFMEDREPPRNSDIHRKSISVVRDRTKITPNQVVVDLTKGVVEIWQTDEGRFPQFTPEEWDYVEQVVRNDRMVQERCKRAGYPNMTLVEATTWPIGYIKDRPEYKGKRVAQVYMFGKNYEADNSNAHPFDFLPIVDIVEGKVINIEELPTQSSIYDDGTNKTNVVVPKAESNYDPALKGYDFFRKDLKPVRTCQKGTSYSLSWNELKWQKFKLRLGFNGREGLVLYWVSYNDNSTVKPLFYRLSFSEMLVPYGDPRPPYHRRMANDEGHYGLGYLANSLRAQEDCIGNVAFLDATLHDEKGEPVNVPRVVCIREEDDGIGWKHTNLRTGKPYITRRQRLALTFISTIGHYDYIYEILLYQDATIEFKVGLTGILSVNLLAINAGTAGHGTIVDKQINAAFHQHYFAIRVDPELGDGNNTVVMADVVPGNGRTGSPTNKYGNAFRVNRTVFTKAGEARTNVDWRVRRTWVVTNVWPIDPSEQTVGWKLWPAPSPMFMLQDDSPLINGAGGGFTRYNTWVTPYSDDQLYAGGQYLKKGGLGQWVKDNPDANIANSDIVLWHILDVTHVPRTEDYPVMPIETASVRLEPFNFFKANPALDVPQVQRENIYRKQPLHYTDYYTDDN